MYLTSKDRLAKGRFEAMLTRLPASAPPDIYCPARGEDPGTGNAERRHASTPARTSSRGSRSSGSSTTTTTFENTPLAQQQAGPDATANFRTPRYGFDPIYARGPVAEPQVYAADRTKLLLATNVNGVEDVPRDGNPAVIREARNDET